MDFYAELLESMMACCGRIGVRRAPLYTLSMLALGLGLSLNILSVIDLLWILGVVSKPLPDCYRTAPAALPGRGAMRRLSRQYRTGETQLQRRIHASPRDFGSDGTSVYGRFHGAVPGYSDHTAAESGLSPK